ncbi:MAG: GNAT family protein [Chloroflexi bacterium]|nr:GNAT family protein [Chloroflexota bacterium]MCY4110650.1 GNAT family protein [Chloroflexota bacterium]
MPLPDPADHEPIQGPRLRLRPITPDDLPDLLRWLGDPEVMAFYGRPPSSLVEARGEFLEPSNLPCWRFIIEADGRAVGEIQYGYWYADVTWSAGIDIFIGEPDARDRGLGTEAIRTLLQYLFETKRMRRVAIDPEPSNHRAIRAYEKAGFRFDGVIRRHAKVDDRWADAAFMTILDEEWPAAKARWQAPDDSA